MNLFAELKRRNVIRVAIAYVAGAWLLIQVVETLFPVYGLSDNAIRLVVAILAVGFVPALIGAWIFELTPEGLKFDSEIAADAASRVRVHRILDRVIMVTLGLAVAYFAFDKFVLAPQREADVAEQARSEALIESYGEKSIAVLPFVNMSPDPEQAFFADGISEELLNLLARIPELRVISRSSAFSFRGDDINVRDVADKLDVSHVLEGSVRKSGDRIRITAQLIEARTDTHLWSETYDRNLGDVFEIQDNIARLVVGELETRLVDQLRTSRRTDPDAYALYLQAQELANAHNAPSEQVESLLRRSLDIEPDYAPAWTALAAAIWNLTTYLDGDVGKYSRAEGQRLAMEALQKALTIDPHDGVANAYVGWARFFDDRDLSAVELFEKAVAREPNNVEVIRSTGGFARALGHWDTAIALGQRAIDLDPLCRLCYWNLATAYLYARRLDEAEAVSRKRIALFDYGWYRLGETLLLKGEAEAALEAFDELKRIGNDEQWLLGRTLALYALGQLEESRASFAEYREAYAYPTNFAAYFARVGDIDAAFESLDQSWDTESPGFRFDFLMGPAWAPEYDSLHDDPRWQAYWQAAGTTAEELQAIEFNVNLPAFR